MLNCYLFRPINSIYNDRNLTAACFSRFNKTISNHKWIGHLGHVQNRCRRISHTKGWCTRCSDQADGYRNLLPLTIVSIPMISRIQYQVNVIQTAVSLGVICIALAPSPLPVFATTAAPEVAPLSQAFIAGVTEGLASPVTATSA